MTKVEEIEATRDHTAVWNARIDVRTAAELALFFKSRGEVIRTKSWLTRLISEALRDVLRSNNLLPRLIETTEEGIEVLREMGLGDLLKDRRGAVKLRDVVVGENFLRDNAGIESGEIDREVLAAARELMEKMGKIAEG